MVQTKKILVLAILIMLGSNLLAQYYVKTKEDSTAFKVDSLILTIDDLPGIKDWEASYDSISWISLERDNDTLVVRIDSSAYYRAKLTVESCSPVSSEIALVGYKTVNAVGTTVTIDSTGCVYAFESGLKLIVPPGAVEEETVISIELLDSARADLILPLTGYTGNVFCVAINCTPAETEFLEPVKIRVPASKYKYFDIPFVYLLDQSDYSWIQNTDPLICSPAQSYIEFSTEVLLPARIELTKDVFGSGKSSSVKQEAIDCHEILVKIETLSHDLQNRNIKNECFVIEDNLKVQFTQCKGDNIDTSHFLEISDDCVPEITSYLNRTCLRNGDKVTISFSVRIGPAGGMPLENQTIVVGVPQGLSVTPEEPKTDSNGIAFADIECNSDNFDGDVDYLLLARYYLTEISASAGGEFEYHHSAEKSVQVPGKRHLNSCGSLPKTASIELTQPPNPYIDVNVMPNLHLECLDEHGTAIQCNLTDVDYIIESHGNQDVMKVVNGILTATNPGYALIKVRGTDWDGTILESNTIGLSVAYKGSITAEGDVDWNGTGHGCCCPLDGDQMLEHCWHMIYSGHIDMKFWLDYDEARPAFGIITGGCETQSWIIKEPSNCRSDSYEYVLTCPSAYETIGMTTGEIMQGQPFSINFLIYQLPSHFCVKSSGDALPNNITVGGQWSAGSVIISDIYYIAHECFEYAITGNGVLH